MRKKFNKEKHNKTILFIKKDKQKENYMYNYVQQNKHVS